MIDEVLFVLFVILVCLFTLSLHIIGSQHKEIGRIRVLINKIVLNEDNVDLSIETLSAAYKIDPDKLREWLKANKEAGHGR